MNNKLQIPINVSKVSINSHIEADCDIQKQPLTDIIELNVVTSGKGIHKILNETTECQVGDLYIISNGISHCYLPSDDNNFPTVLKISFNPKDILPAKYSDTSSFEFCYGIFRDKLPISYALLNSKILEEVKKIIENLQNELNEENLQNFEAAKAYLSLMLIKVARYINLANTVLPNHSKNSLIISATIREILKNSSDAKMTLESIANSLYISSSYLSRIFKRSVGESFLDYVRKLRINKACKLLTETTLTNEEIINKCGLKDAPTFYRQFKLEIGMTPNQYRKNNNIDLILKNANQEEILNSIADSIKNGKYHLIKEQIEDALNSNVSAEEILNNGLIRGMNTIAEQFKNNEVFVPTVLIASKTMNIGIETLKPYLVDINNEYVGTVCIGTVRGDLHDIGKNLVKIIMESKKLKVIDLGVDVSPEEFINSAIKYNCKVICCSALLSTTMHVMKEVVDLAVKSGIRDKVKILVGGAPLDQAYCDDIGADLYTPEAVTAAEAALNFCR